MIVYRFIMSEKEKPIMKQYNIDNKYDPHSVTMSALAASTAIVRGVFSSMSAAF